MISGPDDQARTNPVTSILYAFDLLYRDGRDLRRLPQSDRRRGPQPILIKRDGAVRLSAGRDRRYRSGGFGSRDHQFAEINGCSSPARRKSKVQDAFDLRA